MFASSPCLFCFARDHDQSIKNLWDRTKVFDQGDEFFRIHTNTMQSRLTLVNRLATRLLAELSHYTMFAFLSPLRPTDENDRTELV